MRDEEPQLQPARSERRIPPYAPTIACFILFLCFALPLYSYWGWFIEQIKQAIMELLAGDQPQSQPPASPLVLFIITATGSLVSAAGTITTMVVAIRKERRETREARRQPKKRR